MRKGSVHIRSIMASTMLSRPITFRPSAVAPPSTVRPPRSMVIVASGKNSTNKSGKSTPMTSDAAARIQAAEAKAGGGGVEKGGFASRAQV